MKRPFQVRSAQRDAQTDQERIGAVLQAISVAIGSAQKERDALRERVREARDLASFAIGTGDDEYLTREPQDTSRIKHFEQQMMIGEKRIGELDQQIESLTELKDLSTRRFSELMK